jgi:carbon storage regulator CsrA
MLVLTRKPGQRIEIDGSIRCVVLGVAGGRVRIGVAAPARVPIVREELMAGPVADRPGPAKPKGVLPCP